MKKERLSREEAHKLLDRHYDDIHKKDGVDPNCCVIYISNVSIEDDSINSLESNSIEGELSLGSTVRGLAPHLSIMFSTIFAENQAGVVDLMIDGCNLNKLM